MHTNTAELNMCKASTLYVPSANQIWNILSSFICSKDMAWAPNVEMGYVTLKLQQVVINFQCRTCSCRLTSSSYTVSASCKPGPKSAVCDCIVLSWDVSRHVFWMSQFCLGSVSSSVSRCGLISWLYTCYYPTVTSESDERDVRSVRVYCLFALCTGCVLV